MSMKFVSLLVLVVLVAGAAVYGLYRYEMGSIGQEADATSEASSAAVDGEEPIVEVEAVKVTEGSVETPIEMLGAVAPLAGALVSHSLGGEATVVSVLASPGQHVDQGTPVLQLRPSPAMVAQIHGAEESLKAEHKALAATEERVNGRLATKSDLLAAERSLRTAELQLQNLRDIAPPDDGLLRSQATGTVTSILTSEGATVLGNTTLFQVVPDGRIALRFGIPLSALGGIHPGDTVSAIDLLSGVEHPVSVTVERVDASVDPLSRTLTAWTHPIDSSVWNLGAPVRVTATLQSPAGLVVPRSAIVLDGDRPGIFIVDQNRAHRHEVTILGQSATSMSLEAPGLAPGQWAIVIGNYELSDGALVSLKGQK